ncbi:hypothetical protein [Pseudoduganella chitinolytica]|uniref:Uncharacterized protein n=1 Tax=Pseudoduganella chitinolytica TaxID=34070 RepID=A0ABY8BJM3_9BURK|nr:hypothetical protein [Pseudoduganella chitinolytica]WEF34564.1 hypothetical protein PX653_07305 [Pseudoduganella chitinolytica]
MTAVLAVVLAAGTGGPVQAEGQTKGQAMDMGVGLAVDTAGGHVRVNVQVENRGKQTVYVPRALASASQLDGRLFDVRDARTGAEIPYQGRMVKRGPLTAADFLAVPAGGTHRHSIDITPAYAFAPGPHEYRLSYAGQAGSDVQALVAGSAGAALVAPAVTFKYTAR